MWHSIGLSSPKKQNYRNRRFYIFIVKGLSHEELAHMIMEAEKSHDLLSFKLVCWLKVWEPESWWCRSQSAIKAGEPGGPKTEENPCSTCKAGRKHSTFLAFLFCSDPQQVGDANSHWWRTYALFSPPIHKVISSRNALTDTPRNNV